MAQYMQQHCRRAGSVLFHLQPRQRNDRLHTDSRLLVRDSLLQKATEHVVDVVVHRLDTVDEERDGCAAAQAHTLILCMEAFKQVLEQDGDVARRRCIRIFRGASARGECTKVLLRVCQLALT